MLIDVPTVALLHEQRKHIVVVDLTLGSSLDFARWVRIPLLSNAISANFRRPSISVADGVPAWTALAVSMLPSPQTWNLEAMRGVRLLGWNILQAGAVLG